MFLVTSRPIIDSGSFSVLYFFSFLLLVPSRGGDVIGPSHPLSALAGEDIILPCHLQPAVDVSRETVEWSRSDLELRLVYVWRGSIDVETIEHASYKGRASLFLDEMKHGNISLRLSKVRLSDGGTYRCFVPEMGSSSTVQLVVGAASSPVIQMSNNSNSGNGDGGRVVLQCESAGWYPEPEVLWLDAEGNLLSAGPPETARGPDDLYTVSSRVTVDKSRSNSFTCRVQQNNISQTREAHINVPVLTDLSTPGSSSSSAAIIGLIVAFVVIVVVIVSVFVWKWRQRRLKNKKHLNDEETLREKKKNDPSTESLMERRRDGETAEDEDTERRPGLHPQIQDETHQIQTNQGEREEGEGITERNCLDNRKEETETEHGRENTDNKMEEEPEMENNQQTEEGEKTTQHRGDEMESQRLMDEGKDGEELMDKEKEKLKTKLQAKEREEKKWEERLSRLKSCIEDKEKQINELLQQLEEVEREMESEKPPLETKKDLEKKKSELQKDLEKMKREKERMKKDETVLIERIKKAANEKEEIIRKLEEMEKQRNEGENQSDSDEDL